jgi:hypothetical protein
MGRRSVEPGRFFFALALLAAGGAFAAEPKGTRVETARWAAGINATSAGGREWLDRHAATVSRLVMPVLNECLPDEGDELTAFSVYVRISRKGRVQEIVTDVDASLGTCMTVGGRALQLPEAPRDDYWIRVNLAASL